MGPGVEVVEDRGVHHSRGYTSDHIQSTHHTFSWYGHVPFSGTHAPELVNCHEMQEAPVAAAKATTRLGSLRGKQRKLLRKQVQTPNSHTHTHTLTHSLSLAHSLYIYISLTHTHSLSLSLSLPLSLTHTHTYIYIHIHIHIHMHIHIHIHTHTRSKCCGRG